MDEGDEGEQAEHDESDEPDQPAPSAFPAFGSAPSAFGTPAFTGGSSGGALSGGASVFGGAAPKTAFSGSAFGAASTAFSGSAFGAVSNPSAFSSTPAPAPSSAAEAPPSKPTPNQISTLEVLGEDSESRKKRFESSLANNRYLEVSSSLSFDAEVGLPLSCRSSNLSEKLSVLATSRVVSFLIL